MAWLTSFPYTASDFKSHYGESKSKDKEYVGIRPEANEYYHDITGFKLDHDNAIDYELSFGMRYSNDGTMIVRGATLKMTYSELQKLKKVLEAV